MFFETVQTEGLAHLSYVVGRGSCAAVIDPRRDVDIYLELARAHGARIIHIFETHRNEDYVIGSTELAKKTGASIYHGHAFDFGYGEPVRHGDVFELDSLQLEVLETPGHTDESISIVLRDTDAGSSPLMVFTGDALFVGDVGRTDFYPDRPEEVADALYQSIHEVLLPLGDQVILCPAHGAGSVCGSGMADRNFSTLGYERAHNPKLQLSRDELVRQKVQEHHPKPPYFEKMEAVNAAGPETGREIPLPIPLDADAFAAAMEVGAWVVDVRSPEALSGALVPGSLGIPVGMLATYAGYFLPYDRDLLLVAETAEDRERAVRSLYRLGYDRVTGYLAKGLHAWSTSGRPYHTIPAVSVHELIERRERKEQGMLLDVRSAEEFESGHWPGSTNVPMADLLERLEDVPVGTPITTFCGSGQRAVVAATILLRHGHDEVGVCLGSMAACKAAGCPIESDR
ncbi:MAG: rhodanese-like domain-containing protein [Planctomycetota bacterium]